MSMIDLIFFYCIMVGFDCMVNMIDSVVCFDGV